MTSYEFKTFEDPAFQLERLKTQAIAVREIERKILAEAGIKDTDTILEVGCGPGFSSALLIEMVNQGHFIGLDASHDLLRLFQKNAAQTPSRASLIQGSTDQLPFANDSLNFVYARFLYQHLTHPEQATAELHRVLKPGGHACIVDSDDGLIVCHPPLSEFDSLINEARAAQTALGGDRHVGRKLATYMAQAGFSAIRSSVLMFTADQIPFNTLFNILLGYKASIGGHRDRLGQLHAKLQHGISQEGLLLAGGVIVTIGTKHLSTS